MLLLVVNTPARHKYYLVYTGNRNNTNARAPTSCYRRSMRSVYAISVDCYRYYTTTVPTTTSVVDICKIGISWKYYNNFVSRPTRDDGDDACERACCSVPAVVRWSLANRYLVIVVTYHSCGTSPAVVFSSSSSSSSNYQPGRFVGFVVVAIGRWPRAVFGPVAVAVAVVTRSDKTAVRPLTDTSRTVTSSATVPSSSRSSLPPPPYRVSIIWYQQQKSYDSKIVYSKPATLYPPTKSPTSTFTYAWLMHYSVKSKCER